MDKKPTKGEYLEVLLRLPQTVFTTKDAALLWSETNSAKITGRLSKYVRVGKLIRVRRSIYVKDEEYNRFELATRIYTPAYISFETVLARTGMTFQYYETIFVASYVTREIKVGTQTISFIRMKDYVLCNTTGVEQQNGVATATRERAFLDRIYISKDYYFDNLGALDWDRVFEILPIYHNKRMEHRVGKYFKHYQSTEV